VTFILTEEEEVGSAENKARQKKSGNFIVFSYAGQKKLKYEQTGANAVFQEEEVTSCSCWSYFSSNTNDHSLGCQGFSDKQLILF
jgi:hypothetical protein